MRTRKNPCPADKAWPEPPKSRESQERLHPDRREAAPEPEAVNGICHDDPTDGELKGDLKKSRNGKKQRKRKRSPKGKSMDSKLDSVLAGMSADGVWLDKPLYDRAESAYRQKLVGSWSREAPPGIEEFHGVARSKTSQDIPKPRPLFPGTPRCSHGNLSACHHVVRGVWINKLDFDRAEGTFMEKSQFFLPPNILAIHPGTPDEGYGTALPTPATPGLAPGIPDSSPGLSGSEQQTVNGKPQISSWEVLTSEVWLEKSLYDKAERNFYEKMFPGNPSDQIPGRRQIPERRQVPETPKNHREERKNHEIGKSMGMEHLESLPMGMEHLETLPKGMERLENLPMGMEHLETLPKGIEHLETLSKGIERLEKLPKGIERLETLPKGIEHLENLPMGMEHLETLPKGIERLETLPKGIERLETLPMGMEHLENLPIGMKHLENLPMGMKHLETLPKGIERLENRPMGIERLETLPKGIERLENLPMGIEHLENLPMGMERLVTLPMGIEHLETLPKGMEHLENLPRGIERLENLPMGIEHLENLPMGIEHLEKLPMGMEHLEAPPTIPPLPGIPEENPSRFFLHRDSESVWLQKSTYDKAESRFFALEASRGSPGMQESPLGIPSQPAPTVPAPEKK